MGVHISGLKHNWWLDITMYKFDACKIRKANLIANSIEGCFNSKSAKQNCRKLWDFHNAYYKQDLANNSAGPTVQLSVVFIAHFI